MSAPRKYGDELRDRATRMAVEARQNPATKDGAIKRVADQLGMHHETLRNWVHQAEVDGGVRPGTTLFPLVVPKGIHPQRARRALRCAHSVKVLAPARA